MKFFVSNGITATESLFQKCFGESTLLRTQLFEWHKAFSEYSEVIKNLSHASHPSISVNEDIIAKVVENCRVGIRKIVENLNIPYGLTHYILVNDLGMKHVNARLVSKKNLNRLLK